MSDIQETLKQRGSVHGDFTDNADISQELKKIVRRSVRWETMTAVQREAVDNVLQKIARLCSGDPDYEDHWVDMIGYATLSKDRLPGPKDVVPKKPLREQFQEAIEASKDAPPSVKIKNVLCETCTNLIPFGGPPICNECFKRYVESQKAANIVATTQHQNCRKCSIPLQFAESRKVGVCLTCQRIEEEARHSVTED